MSAAVGLIPAYAGKTAYCFLRSARRGAHPRVCGENRLYQALLLRVAGSSPRMRGKLVEHYIGTARGRLIPAYAGKTPSLRTALGRLGAHPRVCGENA